MPSCAAMAPIAQHRGGDAQLACDLDQRPTAARQQGDRLPLELNRKMTPFLTHSTPFRSRRSLAKVSTNSGEAHTADSTVLDEMTRHLVGKLYADKGYIGRELFHKLWRRGLHLITSIRRNMRNYLMPLADKVMLRKRFLIETVLDTLKSEMGLEHSRHRSVVNAMVHVLSCLVAYAFRPGKPSISLTAQKITAYP